MTVQTKRSFWQVVLILGLALLGCNSIQSYVDSYVAAQPTPTATPFSVDENVSELFVSNAQLTVEETTDIQVGIVQIVGSNIPIQYQWSASKGIIVDGQNTCCITYQAPADPGSDQITLNVTYGDQVIQRVAVVQIAGPVVTVEPTPTPTLVVPTVTPEPTDVPLEDAAAYFARAEDRYTRRDLDGTLADYSKAIEMGYDPIADAYYNRGYIYYIEQEYDLAIEDFAKAIELNYDPLSLPYYNRANTYFYTGKNEEAIADYTRAIDLEYDPLAYIYNSRGLTYRKIGEYDLAIADYTKAIELEHSPLSWPYYNRANAFADKESYDQAIADYTEVINIDPANAGAYLGRGLVYKTIGESALAKLDFNEVLILGDELQKKEADTYIQELEAQ
ncbi:MAG: tetratricopeptide repeat protein [Anaerolineae bacterium]|nr:tetratricopeptide repeat protein [Anaerolineae bacterium]